MLYSVLCMFRFIEGDFDAYVKRLQQPYVWGGEPELLMASHVLKWVLYCVLFYLLTMIFLQKYGNIVGDCVALLWHLV